MKLFLTAVFLGLVAGSDDHYEVPEPIFEVFTPKGLRISLPDGAQANAPWRYNLHVCEPKRTYSKDVRSVEFFVNLPDCPQPLFKEVNRTDGNHWVYWNPDVALRLYDKLRYKLMIQRKDIYWKKEGTHLVQKVLPLKNETDCTENRGQKIISGFTGLGGGVEERNKGLLTVGKSSNLKSAYSTYKNSELKPITKSSMSTTSGTFYIKPSGVMEATGYKKGSSFDSTKREGEQWEHYQSELTAEELENMKNLYGSGFHDFQRFQGSLFPTSAKMYEKSYMSSESKSFPSSLHLRYGESQPLTTHQFHETHKTHETSSFSHSKPVFQYSDSTGGGFVETNSKAEKLYRVEPFTGLPNPLPPQGTLFKATEYIRKEHTVPTGELSQVHVERESHSGASSPQKIIQVSQSGEFSSHNQEVVKPVYPQTTTTSRRADQLEYNSGNLQTVDREDYRSRVYLGSIFKSVKTSKVKTPQECNLVPGLDYNSSGNVRELEKNVYELSCLATLAESTMKEEFALLKQKNNDLNRRLELLEHEVKRISSTCNCYE